MNTSEDTLMMPNDILQNNILTNRTLQLIYSTTILPTTNFSEIGIDNGTMNTSKPTLQPSIREFVLWRNQLYRSVVPVMLAVCIISILFNLTILSSIRWVKKRSTSPTLFFSVSLAVANAYSSLAIGLGLLFNSLLPYGYGINVVSNCHIIVLEAFRLTGPIISVLHLLALAINHYIGILKPLHYASVVTKQKTFVCIWLIWILPCLYIFVYFTSVPGEGFLSSHCSVYNFLLNREFRIAFSVVFFVPFFVMAFIYLHIFVIVKKHHAEVGQYHNHMKKNVKAIVTTLLILGTYIVGWMPAVLIYVLFCLTCLFPTSLIPHRTFIVINIIINSLIILKSLIDSLVYATRNQEIHRALIRLKSAICCHHLPLVPERMNSTVNTIHSCIDIKLEHRDLRSSKYVVRSKNEAVLDKGRQESNFCGGINPETEEGSLNKRGNNEPESANDDGFKFAKNILFDIVCMNKMNHGANEFG